MTKKTETEPAKMWVRTADEDGKPVRVGILLRESPEAMKPKRFAPGSEIPSELQASALAEGFGGVLTRDDPSKMKVQSAIG